MSVAIHRTGAPLTRYRIPDGYGDTWVYRAGSTWVSPGPPPIGRIELVARARVILQARPELELTPRPRIVMENRP